jgi:hypothetical protein
MATNPGDYALVVGINDYPSFRPLTGAVADATKFAAWLTEQQHGGGLPEENCKTVFSQLKPVQPLQDEIDVALQSIFAAIAGGRARRFYFYFSGHGFAEAQTKTHLCLAAWSEVRRKLALDAEDYLNTIAASGKFDEIVFLMDCCRVRMVRPAGLPCTLDWARPQNAPETRIFKAYASDVFTQAFEADNSGEIRGYFTLALLQALQDGTSTPGEGVTAEELKTYLELHVPRLASSRQRPEVLNGLDGSVRFGAAARADATRQLPVTIAFGSRSAEISLEGPDAIELRRDMAGTGPWQMNLRAGLHVITDMEKRDEKIFRVQPGKEPLHVDF